MRPAALLFATAMSLPAVAVASPLIADPGVLTVSGDVTVVYVSSDAGDSSVLNLVTPESTELFRNKGRSAAVAGSAVSLGDVEGPIAFQLDNMTMGYAFQTGVADSGAGGDGFVHAKYSADYSSISHLALPSAVANVLAGFAASTKVTFVGFEDRRQGDYDYNDLIFAVLDTPLTHTALSSLITPVPEPASMTLLVGGLMGVGVGRRRIGPRNGRG